MRVSSEGVIELDEQGIVEQTQQVEVITGTPGRDPFDKIAGKVIKLVASEIVDGKQKIYYPPAKVTTTPKDEGPGSTEKDSSGTLTSENGSQEDNLRYAVESGEVEEFYYCYDCKDAWEIDDDDFLDMCCPYCGNNSITIVEMSDEDVRELSDDWSFFHQ